MTAERSDVDRVWQAIVGLVSDFIQLFAVVVLGGFLDRLELAFVEPHALALAADVYLDVCFVRLGRERCGVVGTLELGQYRRS